jgi:glycosyltransferase involved in cell wall biosynthesis
VPSRFAIYRPAGFAGIKRNPFGMDVANFELFRALAVHGGYEHLDVLAHVHIEPEDLAALADGAATPPSMGAGGVLDQAIAARSGVLLRGQPDLAELAWLRRRTVGDRAYSLIGLIHTLAPPATRQTIAMSSLAPVHPWDALICTSPAVREATQRLFDDWCDHVSERFGGTARPTPRLALIPLGVNAAALASRTDRPGARDKARAELELGDADILVLWVGRLSFFEKAFPQPMFRAVEEAARITGARVEFVMAGWFPDEATQRPVYEAAARAHAPSVRVRFLDGNDRERLAGLWAAADIFLSLVDNIQETFGITPLEAMAAGLPVVASDWDGYRYTVRDGVEGFLVPTLSGPTPALGRLLGARHALGIDSYQVYAGSVAQYTAVNIPRAAQALAELISRPDLRRRMGEAGRARVREAFDWPVVVRQVNALADELAGVRTEAPAPASRHIVNPAKGDPFQDFAGFASRPYALDLAISARPGVGAEDLARSQVLGLDQFAGMWRATEAECARILQLLSGGEAATPRAVLERFPIDRRRAVELGLVWMMKLGLVDWAAETPGAGSGQDHG